MTSQDVEIGQLSDRERQVAEAYAAGETYQQIADRLCLSPATVRTHLGAIYRKLAVSSKIELSRALDIAAVSEADFPAVPDKPSIAVLAFENMSGDPEQAYFSDGISEDIITALSRSPWLFVIARNTTFTYKGENTDLRRVARELGVRFVLEGSVRRAGARIRVTAQLIDGSTGGHVWSERYDGHLQDVFDLQDEITRNVVASIQTSVQLTAAAPVERSNRPDLTVWELTMRAWHLLYDFSPDSYETAIDLLERALVRDVRSAEATFVMALIYHHIALLGFVHDTASTARKAYTLGLRATALDPNNEYAHWAHGISCFALDRHDEAIAALERAVELNPNCSVAYGSLGTALAMVGRTQEAIRCQEIAIRSNPRDPSIFFRFAGLAMAQYLAGQFETAADWAARAVHRMPTWFAARFIHIAALSSAGRAEDAGKAVVACMTVLPQASVSDMDRYPLSDTASMAAFKTCLRNAGIPETRAKEEVQ
ncbi:MAG: LuxR C-terminal-related transcriptional regulator [Pseudomonadota bacterium]